MDLRQGLAIYYMIPRHDLDNALAHLHQLFGNMVFRGHATADIPQSALGLVEAFPG